MSGIGILGLLGVGVSLIVASLVGALRGLLSKEVEASLPSISRNLLARAANRLPAEHRERFLEEWSAELGPAIQGRPLWALMQAASLYRAAPRIAAELAPAPVPVQGQSNGTGLISRPANRLLGRVLPGLAALRSLLTSVDKRVDEILERILFGPNPADVSMARIMLVTAIALLLAAGSVLYILEMQFGL